MTEHVPIPDRRLLRLLAVRGVLLLVLAHLMVALVAAFASAGAPRGTAIPIRPSPVQAFWIVVLCAVLAWIDLRRRREVLFFGNLGLSLPTVLAWMLWPALLVEIGAFMLVPD